MAAEQFSLFGDDLFGDAIKQSKSGPLAERFEFPPFSVLNAREWSWQERKRAWLACGIRGEVGRQDKNNERSRQTSSMYLVKAASGQYAEGGAIVAGGDVGASGSVFDPVLCEIAYRWFCPAGGQVVDPFAGGSVRGIVAALLGFRYWGAELRPEQVAANEEQRAAILGNGDSQPELTPMEQHGGHWVKRDDAYAVAGTCGGKARTCWALARGATGLVTAGSRSSPQANIVAQIANRLGIPCRVHTPEGKLSPELLAAQAAGAEVVQHKAGYNSVIIARAREDAAERGWTNIPFGMECTAAVEATAQQTENLPEDMARLVMPVGSGMSLAGVLTGLQRSVRHVPVLGVVVGADPTARLDRYAPQGWRDMVTLIPAGSDYAKPADRTELGTLRLDSHYEAKCLPHLRTGDVFWVIGIRQTEQPSTLQWQCGDAMTELDHAPPADFVFSCPPYGDLERYSDDPRDLSTMEYETFLPAYKRIILRCSKTLNPGRLACFVVGDFRDKKGNYRGFVADTVNAFRECGMPLYNDAVLLTAVGSLPIRAGKQFEVSRKLGKTHQNVLVFHKPYNDRPYRWKA